jgi:hypothetical protein
VPSGLVFAGAAFQSEGAVSESYGHKKETAGAALERCELEKLKSRPQTEFCKEIRKSFNKTKNNRILPLDRILGFFEIFYHVLDTDCAEGHGFERHGLKKCTVKSVCLSMKNLSIHTRRSRETC